MMVSGWWWGGKVEFFMLLQPGYLHKSTWNAYQNKEKFTTKVLISYQNSTHRTLSNWIKDWWLLDSSFTSQSILYWQIFTLLRWQMRHNYISLYEWLEVVYALFENPYRRMMIISYVIHIALADPNLVTGQAGHPLVFLFANLNMRPFFSW